MRNVVYGINLTLDGCCDHTKANGSEDIHEYFTQLLQKADTVVYGRKTYELMVPYWPDVEKNLSGKKTEIEFAKAFNALKKVVFSRSLTSTEDENTRIVSTDLRNEILRLKQQPGKDISIGGVDLPSQLIQLGLIDEFYFVVHPIIAGAGRRLFNDTMLPQSLGLKLVDSQTLPSGCVALHYIKH